MRQSPTGGEMISTGFRMERWLGWQAWTGGRERTQSLTSSGRDRLCARFGEKTFFRRQLLLERSLAEAWIRKGTCLCDTIQDIQRRDKGIERKHCVRRNMAKLPYTKWHTNPLSWRELDSYIGRLLCSGDQRRSVKIRSRVERQAHKLRSNGQRRSEAPCQQCPMSLSELGNWHHGELLSLDSFHSLSHSCIFFVMSLAWSNFGSGPFTRNDLKRSLSSR